MSGSGFADWPEPEPQPPCADLGTCGNAEHYADTAGHYDYLIAIIVLAVIAIVITVNSDMQAKAKAHEEEKAKKKAEGRAGDTANATAAKSSNKGLKSLKKKVPKGDRNVREVDMFDVEHLPVQNDSDTEEEEDPGFNADGTVANPVAGGEKLNKPKKLSRKKRGGADRQISVESL